ncbi:MAG: hypothetical protein COW13_02115 [Candidatus Omnitrophica bacterium CG12_big_fil_rev_8_21_14_0_65_50_5]|nr:MAG: hypothetical protein COW13_02115 [Candidatus Omnitrophica bacterium CG12_big_fil_rev_8_21_14_0_65_50_5]
MPLIRPKTLPATLMESSVIKPFKAVHYNPSKVKDMQKVFCPPYDVISDEDRDMYMKSSPYNFIHLDLPQGYADDSDKDDKYARAKKLFDQFFKDDVFVQDKEPSIYVHKQEYKSMGQRFNRVGFVSLLKLDHDTAVKIHPHEKTHENAVQDRLSLTRALNSALSPIFVCYSDKQKILEKIFNKKIVSTKPLCDVVDKNGVRNVLWKLSDPQLIKDISDSVSSEEMFIADGHHRFRTANLYREMRLKDVSDPAADHPFNYALSYFTNLDSKDLQILPMHRIVKTLPKNLAFLDELFRIDRIRSLAELQVLLNKAGRNEHAFGLVTKNGFQLLRLKNKTMIDQMIKEGSPEYRRLDATILKHFVFDRLKIKSEDIVYTKDIEDGRRMIQEGAAEALFVLNPVKVSELKAIALNGEKMPQKTTYFYPKILSGLTVYKMD